jgi:hypothetical protein
MIKSNTAFILCKESETMADKAIKQVGSFFEPHRRKIVLILFVSLIIRLIIMPLFLHNDLAAEYWRTYQFVFNQDLEYFNILKAFSHLVHAVGILFTSIFIHPIAEVFPDQPLSFVNYYPDIEAYQIMWSQFIADPKAYALAFLFKVPYLVFDYIGAFALMTYAKSPQKKVTYLLIWLFNPILIFTAYVWGRYDIIMVVLWLVSFIFLSKKKYGLSILMLFLSLFIKPTAVFFVPFYLIYILKKYNRSILQIIIVFAVGLFGVILADHVFGLGVLNILKSGHFAYLFDAKYAVHHYLIENDMRIIFIYPLLYSIILLDFLLRKTVTFYELVRYISVVFLLYFSLGYFHEHYFSWVIPFIILLWFTIRDIGKLHLVQISFFLGAFSLSVFYHFFIPAHHVEWITSVLSKLISNTYYDNYFWIMYTFFTGSSVYMIFKLLNPNLTSLFSEKRTPE